jgi:ketosteroid isomerase-like protein
MDLNLPAVVAEVAAAFAAYEKALVAGDLDAMAGAFWDSEEVVRFGIQDHQVGAAALRAWRAAQHPLPPGRTLVDPRITTFGDDTAVVTTRFHYPASPAEGRQSQVWRRLPQIGWRVVHAHVSLIKEVSDV